MPNQIFLFFVFVFGAIIGSFLNVVILRYNTGKSILAPKGRSQCFTCAKKLDWYELVPIASFFCLRGRCSSCRSPISWQYPLVEVGTGLIFAKIFCDVLAGDTVPIMAVLYAIVWSLLMVITVYDFRHKIIPDAMVFSFAGVSLACALLGAWFTGGFLFAVEPILAGVVFFSFFAGLWYFSGGRWLGFGDAKLVLGVGFLLGFARGVSALALAFWIGAVVMIILLVVGHLARKKVIRSVGLRRLFGALTMKSEIPFAPFIILGTLIAFFWNTDIFGITRFFFGM